VLFFRFLFALLFVLNLLPFFVIFVCFVVKHFILVRAFDVIYDQLILTYHPFPPCTYTKITGGGVMFRRKRLTGLICFFIGVGMIVQFMMPAWGFLIASALIILGFWYVFAR